MESLAQFGDWRATRETVRERLDPWRARALSATLALDGPAPCVGDVLRPARHWVHFAPAPPHDRLGEDGHAETGGFLPPAPNRSRMWVSGRIRAGVPLHLGETARRDSRVVGIAEKSGRSGRLRFVTVDHRISSALGEGLAEEQVLAYRDGRGKGGRREGVDPPGRPARRREWRADERMLFRYSALLFNAHRIHYDLDYCRGREGWPGLVVHGPLLATALLEAGMELADGREVAEYRYRAHAPVFHVEQFHACAAERDGGAAMWIEGGAGDARMTAEVDWR